MLFKDYVYLDDQAVCKYSNQLSGKSGKRRLSIDKASSRIKADIGPITAQANLDGTIIASDDDLFSRYELFEKALAEESGDSFFDAVVGEVDLLTLPSMSIVKLYGSVAIPEEFDMFSLMKEYLPFLAKAGIVETSGSVASELTMNLFDRAQADVPIVVPLEELTVFGKLKTGSILSKEVVAIEELEGEDCILLCKVISYQHGEKVAVYDPLKDFMKLSRAMRRQMDRGEGLEPLVIDGPVLKAEILAIYR